MMAWKPCVLGCCLVLGMGCQNSMKHNTEVPMVEEFIPPPEEDRFNNPREEGYNAPPAKKDFKPGPGGGMGGGAPMMMNPNAQPGTY